MSGFARFIAVSIAAELLKTNKALKTAFELKKASDAKFAEDGAAQLDWVYKNSEYYEGSVNQYPIYRIR